MSITWRNVTVQLGALKPWADNPRFSTKAQAKRLLKSWDELGQFQTIAVGPEGEVYDGHQRLSALLTVHGPEYAVDARQSDRALTDEERRRIVFAANAPAGNWDSDALASFAPAEQVLEWAGMDALAWGETKREAAMWGEMLESVKPDEEVDAEPQVDRAEALREKWQTERGQLWRIGEHRLLCGDSTSEENSAVLFGDRRAHLGVTSPPYAVGKEYETEVSFSQHIKMLEALADRALGIIEPGGFFFVNFGEIAPQSHAGPLTGSKRQCIYLISKDYWRIFHEERKMDLYAQRIWYKPFNRLQQPFWSYHTSIPHHQEWEHIWTWRLPGGNGDKVYDWDISVHAVWDTRNEATEDKPLTRHVAAFPVCLPERAIKAHSDMGALIWEPFTGSGTTMLVCQNLKRVCYGAELDPTYVAVCLERMATAFPGLTIEKV